MIISFGSYGQGACLDLVPALDAGFGVAPPTETTHNAMMGRITALRDRVRLVDFQWYLDVAPEKPWIQEAYGLRSDLRRSSTARDAFTRRVVGETQNGEIYALASGANDGSRTLEYLREVLRLRGTEFPDHRVIATIVLDRAGLNDLAIQASFSPLPIGVDRIALAVMDVVEYPSVWSETDWIGWLRLVRGFVEAGYEVVLPYSDARGVVGVAVGAAELGTGPQQKLRQIRPAQDVTDGGGGTSSVSYMSASLVSILHGPNASVEPTWQDLESHRGSAPSLGALSGLPTIGSSFDPMWMADGESQGEVDRRRISQHFRTLAELERAVKAADTDDVEAHLERAVGIGASLSPQTFKSSGLKGELQRRLNAFRAVRSQFRF